MKHLTGVPKILTFKELKALPNGVYYSLINSTKTAIVGMFITGVTKSEYTSDYNGPRVISAEEPEYLYNGIYKNGLIRTTTKPFDENDIVAISWINVEANTILGYLDATSRVDTFPMGQFYFELNFFTVGTLLDRLYNSNNGTCLMGLRKLVNAKKTIPVYTDKRLYPFDDEDYEVIESMLRKDKVVDCDV